MNAINYLDTSLVNDSLLSSKGRKAILFIIC